MGKCWDGLVRQGEIVWSVASVSMWKHVVYDCLNKPVPEMHFLASMVSNQSINQQHFSSSSVSAQALGKVRTHSLSSFSKFPKFALKTVPMFAWLNTDRSRPWGGGGGRKMSAASFLPSSFLQGINALML